MSSSSGAGFAFEQLEPPAPAPWEDAVADDVAAIAAAAHRDGFARGYEDGAAQARAALVPAAAALADALAQVETLRDGAVEALEREAVGLALELAEKVLAGALAVQPERVLDSVRGALRRLADREHIVIAVNPEDLPLVREATADLVAKLGGIERVEVQAERRVGRGGAIVRTEVGEIDGTVGAKLESARRAVEAELG